MAAFHIKGIDHVVLRCRDIEAMLAFYCDTLGGTLAKRNERLGLMHVRVGSAMVDLVTIDGELGRAGGAPPAAEGRNMDHFCLRIEPFDPTALSEYFRGRGIEVRDVRTRFGAEGDGVSLYLSDPEGNRVELKGPSAGAG